MRLFRPRHRPGHVFSEDDAYRRLHGERTGEIVSVVQVEREPIPRRTGDLTGELLRRAFEARLDARAEGAAR
ncbi:MAG TPA: hypothetical protein VFJ77_06550 [Gaiellaceae bacterium]|nr:hypothetical protein [Gaiellaceae bacterium]